MSSDERTYGPSDGERGVGAGILEGRPVDLTADDDGGFAAIVDGQPLNVNLTPDDDGGFAALDIL